MMNSRCPEHPRSEVEIVCAGVGKGAGNRRMTLRTHGSLQDAVTLGWQYTLRVGNPVRIFSHFGSVDLHTGSTLNGLVAAHKSPIPPLLALDAPLCISPRYNSFALLSLFSLLS